jgi:hypothetical protein
MKPNQRRSLNLTDRYATVFAYLRRRSKPKSNGRGQVPDHGQARRQKRVSGPAHAEKQGQRKTRKNVWPSIGKVLLAVFGLGMTVASLTLTYADSQLEIVGGMQPEIRGYSSSGKAFTFLCVVYCTVRNSGFKSDYIDRIDMQPADLDETIKSEPKFTDRQIIGWRREKILRFELLISTAIGSGKKHFQLALYDSKGRQVGFVPIATTFPEPSVPMVLDFTPPVDSSESPSKPQPTLVGMTLSGLVPEALRNPQRRYFVTFTAIDGKVVAQSEPSGQRERADGSIEIPIKLPPAAIGPFPEEFPVQFKIWTDPPREPWLAFQMKWTSTWSDGTKVLYVLTPPGAKADEPPSGGDS